MQPDLTAHVCRTHLTAVLRRLVELAYPGVVFVRTFHGVRQSASLAFDVERRALLASVREQGDGKMAR
jgi:hypothetical protein